MTGPRTFESVLASRRMCRDYLDHDVADDQLDAVLRAALRGPAAGNTWALQLVVLRGADVTRYWDVTLPDDRRGAFPWPGLLAAPVLVLPYVEPARYVERYSAPDKVHSGLGAGESAWPVPYWWVDGGAAVMAMLLAAESLGLGALFFGQFGHEESVRDAFGVPGDRRTLGTLAIGHRAGDGGGPSRSAALGRPTLESVRHDGGW
ncbi:MAG: nitroreductase family protein [Actinomycetota bacterium]|nr:nitroreductase family protein [Actinomycetota bacterium]